MAHLSRMLEVHSHGRNYYCTPAPIDDSPSLHPRPCPAVLCGHPRISALASRNAFNLGTESWSVAPSSYTYGQKVWCLLVPSQ
eukprot:2186382-Amphidinium_carterae.2